MSTSGTLRVRAAPCIQPPICGGGGEYEKVVYAKGRHALKLREELKKHVIKQVLTSECYWPNIKRTSKKGGSENGWPELLRKRRDTTSPPASHELIGAASLRYRRRLFQPVFQHCQIFRLDIHELHACSNIRLRIDNPGVALENGAFIRPNL